MSVRNKMPQNMDQNFAMTGETSYRYMAPEVFRHEFYGTSVDVAREHDLLPAVFVPAALLRPNPVDAAKLASMESLRPTMQKDLMPAPLSRIVRTMWDADESKRSTFVQLIELLSTPARRRYAAENERKSSGCCWRLVTRPIYKVFLDTRVMPTTYVVNDEVSYAGGRFVFLYDTGVHSVTIYRSSFT